MKNISKKILTVCAVILAVSAIFSFCVPETTSAADGFVGNCRDFLGLKSWDCNVVISDEASLKSGIWTIVANVATDISVIAAYLIIGYVIYGGYLYTMSGGDVGKVSKGKKVLTHAFIGLAIVILANVILNFISTVLGTNFSSNCVSGGCANPASVVTNAIKWAIAVVGIVAAIFVVYGGITYSTSSGDPGKVQKAKQMILYALIGLVVVALSEIIVSFVSSTIIDATSIEQIIIAKGVL